MLDRLTSRVNPTRLGSMAIAGILIGLLAGLAAATFATIAGEPTIDDAIAIEEADTAASGAPEAEADHHAAEEASVSRSDQKTFGLFGAYGLAGGAFGALLALAAHLLRPGRPGPGHRVLVAGAVLAGGITIAPWLKYPPNPPAVGDPDTLGRRQALYLMVIVFALVVGFVAAHLSRRLGTERWPDHRRIPVVVALVAVPMLAVFALMPPPPDEVTVPADLLWRFRVASLGANLTLWTLLTLGLAWILSEAASNRAATIAPSSPELVADTGALRR